MILENDMEAKHCECQHLGELQSRTKSSGKNSEKQISLGQFLKSTSKILKIFTMRHFLVNFNLF